MVVMLPTALTKLAALGSQYTDCILRAQGDARPPESANSHALAFRFGGVA